MSNENKAFVEYIKQQHDCTKFDDAQIVKIYEKTTMYHFFVLRFRFKELIKAVKEAWNTKEMQDELKKDDWRY